MARARLSGFPHRRVTHMLQTLRDKTSGWIATVVIGLLIIPIGFIGVQDYLVQRSDTHVARVRVPPAWWDGAPSWWPASATWTQEDVTIEAFRQRFEQARQQARQEQGEKFDARAFESADNKRAVLETLIDETVARMAAGRAGLVVSDALVRKTIAEIPGFQVNGAFDRQRYLTALSTQGQSPAAFDQLVRAGLQQTLLTSAVGTSGFVTQTELDRLVKLLGERRAASLVMIPPPAADTAPVTDAQARAWYDSHKAEFRAPETVSLEYVEIDGATLPVPQVDEAALRARYAQEKSRFQSQEERGASHILVRVEAGADAATIAAAQKKAEAIAVQARAAGADFAALAKASSDDLGSKSSGGDLGWIARGGGMPAAFEQALYAMQPGQVSAPVKTDSGWHVIQLRELKAGAQQTFDEVRESLAREQAQSNRDRAYSELSGRLVDALNKNPSSLAPAAKALGLQVLTLGPVVRSADTGILATPAVRVAAFSESAVQDKQASNPIDTGEDKSLVLRVTQHAPERPLAFEVVRARVNAAVQADRASKAATQRATALVARLKKGESFDALTKADGLDAPTVVPDVQRGMPLPTQAVSNAVFAAPVPVAGKPSAGFVDMGEGRMVVFTVNGVTPGENSKLSPVERQQLADQIASGLASEEAKTLVSALRRGMRIEVVEANL